MNSLASRLVVVVVAVLSSSFPVTPASATPGQLDLTFGTDGTVRTRFPQAASASSVAVQSNGKIVAAGVSGGEFALARYTRSGALDPTFGSAGRVVTDVRVGAVDFITDVAVQGDGKIVAAGTSCTSFNPYTCQFALARYRRDGALDSGFGSGGTVTTGVGLDATDVEAFGLALQGDGRIVVAGMSCGAAQCQFAVARFRTDGSPDPSFGFRGGVTTAFGSQDQQAYAYDVAIQPDGRIIAAGSTRPLDPGARRFAVARYDTTGTLDSSFGEDGRVTGGKVEGHAGSDNTINALGIQPDGRIVAAGTTCCQRGDWDIALWRLRQDGSVDPTFGTQGATLTDIAASDVAADLGIQTDGKIVTAGFSVWECHPTEHCPPTFTLARYTRRGFLDRVFGDGGIVVTAIGNQGATAEGMSIQVDGRIVAAGGSGRAFAMARYL